MVPYLEKLRASGASQAMVEGERDSWILMAARWPEKIPEFMVDKLAQLDDPRTVQLYRMLDDLVAGGLDEEKLNAVADLLAELAEQSAERGDLDRQSEEMSDEGFIALLDSFASDAHPMVERLDGADGRTGLVGVEPHRTGGRLSSSRIRPKHPDLLSILRAWMQGPRTGPGRAG